MSPDEIDPQTEELWTAVIVRRAHEVVEGKVTLLDADEMHAEAALNPQDRTKSCPYPIRSSCPSSQAAGKEGRLAPARPGPSTRGCAARVAGP